MNDLFKQIGLTKNLAIAFGVILVVILGWYFFVFSAQMKSLTHAKQEITEMKATLERSRAGIGDVNAVRKKTAQFQQEMRNLKTKILKKKQVPEIISQIVSRGKRNGITFVSIEPATDKLFQAASANSGYFQLPINMDVVADYLDFGRFVEQMNQVPFYFSIEQITMNYSKDLFPKLDINVKSQVVLDQSTTEIATN